MASTKECGTCFGTGQILCATSAFTSTGYRRERCGICAGSGKSSYRDDPAYIRFQRRARIAEAEARSSNRKTGSRPKTQRARGNREISSTCETSGSSCPQQVLA